LGIVNESLWNFKALDNTVYIFPLKITPKQSEGRLLGVFLSSSGANYIHCVSPLSFCKLTSGEKLDEIQTTLNWGIYFQVLNLWNSGQNSKTKRHFAWGRTSISARISKLCGFVLCRKENILNESFWNNVTKVYTP
jgi:hypothetical protein